MRISECVDRKKQMMSLVRLMAILERTLAAFDLHFSWLCGEKTFFEVQSCSVEKRKCCRGKRCSSFSTSVEFW